MRLENTSTAQQLARWIESKGPYLLILLGALYYGYYYNAGIYPSAEGGLEGVCALRLMAGQRPIVDTFLGYNVLWFYPVVWIFKVTGPNYTALRIFFLTLCLITGLLSFRVLMRCSRSPWIALLGGVLTIVIPGQMYRNYMPFLAVLNFSVLHAAYILPPRSTAARMLWMLGAGLVLGITFLIRIDLGYFFSIIMLGMICAFPFATSSVGLRHRVLLSVLGLLLGFLGVFAINVPVAIDADRRGFGPEFAAQYRQWPHMINSQAKRMCGALHARVVSRIKIFSSDGASAPVNGTRSPVVRRDEQLGESSAPIAMKATKAALQRVDVMAPTPRDKMLAINIYLPAFLSLFIGCFGVMVWLRSILWGNEEERVGSLSLLLSLGSALALFPQYFFWRPDMVHLSEFMVPMTLALLLSVHFLPRFSGGLLTKALGRSGALLCLAGLVLYYINACQSQASGGIAVSQHKTIAFKGTNGVDVRMTPKEFEVYNSLYNIIMAVSEPGEPVVCYPYNPEINFMTDRPSYAWNLYADNDLEAGEFFRKETALMDKNHPPVIVINNWDINDTEESRFTNWAAPLCARIASTYEMVFRGGNFEVYVRPDRVALIPEKFRSRAKDSPAP